MWSVHIHSNCRGNVAYQARARDASRSMMTVWISLHVDGRGLAAVYEDVEDETKRWRGMGQPGASEDSRQQAPGRAEQNRKKHTSFVNGLLGHKEHATPTFPIHWQESTMYGYPMQGYGFRSGPPTSYQMPSGPVGPPQYQGYVQTNPQGGVMNGSTSRIH